MIVLSYSLILNLYEALALLISLSSMSVNWLLLSQAHSTLL